MPRRPSQDDFFFLFGYDPIYWRGLRKHGLVDEYAGARLIQCLFTPRHRCFNQFAAPGGCLHEEVWLQRRPLLIDRGCGGINYEDYPFDGRLLDAYARRLGDRFLGVQLHEWVCNTGNDWDRISRMWPKDRPVELKPLQEAFDWRTPATCLETGDPHDFVGQRFPRTPEEFALACRGFFRRKLKDFHGHLASVPSTGLGHAKAMRWGAQVVMPEHGHHIPMARIHTAAARGAVRQEGRGSFGSYFAPWANSPDSVICYTPFSLWYSPAEALCGEAFKWRGNGGCSRAFQRRLFWWAYLTGARFLAEEWGPENTFFDWKGFDLTSYGQVVVDFLDFVRSHGRGRLVTPAAVVIDREGFCLDTYFLAGQRKKWLGFYEPTAHQQAMSEFFRQLIGHKDSPPNDDARVLPASPMPDAFDVVLDDAPAEFLSRYAVLAYVGERPDRFRRKLRGCSAQSIFLEDPARTAREFTEATLARLPLRVEGPVNWLLCRKKDSLQVGIFNPAGVTTDFHKGERSEAKAVATASILGSPSGSRARLSAAWPAGTRIRSAAGRIEVTVGPGGLAVVEIPL
jgi:hypothetical protein